MRDGCLRVNVVVFLLNALCARFRYNNILMKMEHHGWVKQSLFLVIILVRRWDSCTSEVNAASLLHQYTEWLTAQMPAGQPGCGGNGSRLCCNEQQAVQVVEEAGAFCVWNSFYCFSLLFFFFLVLLRRISDVCLPKCRTQQHRSVDWRSTRQNTEETDLIGFDIFGWMSTT